MTTQWEERLDEILANMPWDESLAKSLRDVSRTLEIKELFQEASKAPARPNHRTFSSGSGAWPEPWAAFPLKLGASTTFAPVLRWRRP